MVNNEKSIQRLHRIEASCRVIPDFVALSAAETPDKVAYRQYDRVSSQWKTMTYAELAEGITRWRKALASLGLRRGDRVALLFGNCIDAVLADQAVLANALVPVPMHAIDTPKSSAFLMQDSEAVLFITNKAEHWESIARTGVALPNLKHVLVTEDSIPDASSGIEIHHLDEILTQSASLTELPKGPDPDDLGAIVYTSGTTGNPKGVMLTHKNVVSNVISCLRTITPWPTEEFEFLSFLPLSHTFERTGGYYMPLAMSCTIWFNRSILLLGEDLRIVRPHMFISVPRIYERIYAKANDDLKKKPAIARFLVDCCVAAGWRRHCRMNDMPVPVSLVSWLDGILYPLLHKLVAEKILSVFGGRLQMAIAGGAALSEPVARFFLGLGLPIVHGYGMTECSPVVSVNRLGANNPKTVGSALLGVRVRIARPTNEIQVAGDSVMKGYWKRPADTSAIFDGEWLKTGDVGSVDGRGLIRIRGRIKEIIVTSTGEKVPPVDLEAAIESDPLFTQAYVLGENRPYITFITVLNRQEWDAIAERFGVDPKDPKAYLIPKVRAAILHRAKAAAAGFPHYALPRNVIVTFEPWTVENGFLTPTLKLKRKPLYDHFKSDIEAMYAIHG